MPVVDTPIQVWSKLGRSAPVTTASTPGIARAASESIDTIRAWAWGLRRTAPMSMPGNAKSAP